MTTNTATDTSHLWAAALCATMLCAPSVALANPASQDVVNGLDAQTCDFPSAVYIRDNDGTDADPNTNHSCSAVLVHPRLVLTAGHCVFQEPGALPTTAYFGESRNNAAAAIDIEGCVRHPDYEDTWAEWDLAVCSLAQDAPAVPIVPPLMGCEQEIIAPGTKLVTAGFGWNDPDAQTGDGVKRWTTQTVQEFDWFENDIVVVADSSGGTTCNGDSGSPAFVQFPDGSWRLAAVTSTGYPTESSACVVGAVYEKVYTLVEWVEQTTALDITPCHDGNGTWNPGPECGGFPLTLQAQESELSWTTTCLGAERSGLSNTCGQPWDPPEPDSTGGPEESDTDPSGSDTDRPGGTAGAATENADSDSMLSDPSNDAGCGCQAARQSGRGDPIHVMPLGFMVLFAVFRQRRASPIV